MMYERLLAFLSATILLGGAAGCQKSDASDEPSRTQELRTAPLAAPHAEIMIQPVSSYQKPSATMFSEHCDGVGDPRPTAAGGAAIKPNRPAHLWVTGCSGKTGYFHAIIDRPPTPGPASASLFLLTMPGRKQVEIKNARFMITDVTGDHLAGTFELEIPGDGSGASSEQARGHFDVPRLPDDTSRGP